MILQNNTITCEVSIYKSTNCTIKVTIKHLILACISGILSCLDICDANADCIPACISGILNCLDICDVNADCIGDRCVCRPGYFGDGNSCLSEIVF